MANKVGTRIHLVIFSKEAVKHSNPITSIIPSGLEHTTVHTLEKMIDALKKNVTTALVWDITTHQLEHLSDLKEYEETRDPRIPLIISASTVKELDCLAKAGLTFDDFILPPFAADELAIRARLALNAHCKPVVQKGTLRVGSVLINRASNQVLVRSKKIELTPKEFELLVFLAEGRGTTVSHHEIASKVLGGASASSESIKNRVRVFIARIRRKLGKEKRIIRTVDRVGYIVD